MYLGFKRILLCLVVTLSQQAVADNKIAYPEGYRYWTHVKTLTLHAGHALANPFEGIHHIYANQAALVGLQGGGYKDGAIIVFDLLENNPGDHASAEGKRKLIGVMQRDQRRYSSTGGWGFEAWSGNSRTKRLTSDQGVACFACHTSVKQSDYVFSQWRE